MMKTVVPIILFVAVAGFHNVVSETVFLESAESYESIEEWVFEERTAPEKHDEYEAVHVKEEGNYDELDDVETVTFTTVNQEENTASQTAEHNEQEVENLESRTTLPSFDEEIAYK